MNNPYNLSLSKYSTHNIISEAIGKNNKVLDIGCNDGYIGKIADKSNRFYGLDYLPQSIRITKKAYQDALVYNLHNLKSLPWKTKFDVILFADVLEHVMYPEKVLIFFTKNYLNDNGRIIISLPNIANWQIRMKLLFGNFNYKEIGIMDKTHLHFYTFKSAEKLLTNCSLSLFKITSGASLFGYILSIFPFLKCLFATNIIMIAKKNVICGFCRKTTGTLNSSNIDLLHSTSSEYFNYYLCKECKLIFQYPGPSLEKIKKYYPNDYGPHNNQINLVDRISIKLKNLFPQMTVLEKKYLFDLKNNKNVIDIGCGSGLFLSKLYSKFPQSKYWALDISNNAFKCIENISITKIKHQFIESFFNDVKFDLITMWWYLEHSINPERDIKKAHDIINDNGIFVIAVPNYKSFAKWLFRNFWYNFDAPRHITIFSPEGLSSLLGKNKFKVNKIIYSNSVLGLVGSISLLFKIKNKYLLGFFYIILMPLGYILSFLKLSDLIIIYAQKK